jgi:hypothetical protein
LAHTLPWVLIAFPHEVQVFGNLNVATSCLLLDVDAC